MRYRLNALVTFFVVGLLSVASVQAKDLVYYLVDESSSMQSKNFVQEVLNSVESHSQGLDADTDVYLQFFSSSASELMTWEGFSAEQKNDFLNTFYKEFKPHGSTRLFDTVSDAVDRIRAVASEYEQISLIVFSDSDDTTSSITSKKQQWDLVTPGLLSLTDENAYSRTYFFELPEAAPKAAAVVPVETPVAKAPALELKAKPTQAEPKALIEFTVKNTGGPVEGYVWDFGDGTSIESAGSVKHAYQTEGVYDVSVRAAGADVEDVVTLKDYVKIAYSAPLVSSFRISPEAPTRGEIVSFRSLSKSELDLQVWYVNGKKVGEGSIFEWEATEPGSYEVELKIQLDGRSGSAVQTIVVSPPVITFPESGFKVKPARAIVGEPIQLSANAHDPNFKHAWYVGDEMIGEGGVITYIAETTGEFRIQHVLRHVSVVNAEESSSSVITVYEPALIVPTLQASITVGLAPLEVKFGDTSAGKFVTYAWDFGDGSSSSEANPTHTYTTPGSYSVSLTVTDQIGRSTSSPEPIQVVVEQSMGWFIWAAIGLILLILFLILLAKKKKEEEE